jgi:hypothetical protein
MDNEEHLMDERESLGLITHMINKARDKVNENGTLYIMWGWIVFACSLIHFSSIYFFQFYQAYYIWFLTWLVVIYQIFYLRKKRKQRSVTNYSDAIRIYVWIVFIISILLLVFIFIRVGAFYGINAAILVMYGMPSFLSGVILRFKPLKIGGICCWVLSVIAVFVPYEYQLLLISVAVIVAWLIPGYKLKAIQITILRRKISPSRPS